MNANLKAKIQDWWDNLDDDNYRYELIENYYPGKAHLMGIEEMWNGLDWEEKYELYCNSDDEIELTEEYLEAQATDAAERENHRREVEGREIE